MFTKIYNTTKKFLVDTIGEDLGSLSSGLSKGAIACITCGAIAATAAGTNALANDGNSATHQASENVNKPLNVSASQAAQSQAVYK